MKTLFVALGTGVILSVFLMFPLVADAGQGTLRDYVEPELKTFVPKDLRVDWDKVESTSINLFYPAQVSWDYLTAPQPDFTHPGASAIKSGISCRTCHSKEATELNEEALGKRLVAGTWVDEHEHEHRGVEDKPIVGKRPYTTLKVQAAYDRENIYFRFKWDSEEPGVYHNVLKYNEAEKKWESFGGNKPDAKIGLYEDRLTFLVGHKKGTAGYVTADSGVSYGFQESGCFITCHESMRAMPYDAANNKEAVKKVFPKQSDIRKYILITREDARPGDPQKLEGVTEKEGRWSLLKGKEELKALRQEQKFLDMWMWRAARSGPIGYADDLFVFDYRYGDEGKGLWSRQKPAHLNAVEKHTRMYNPKLVSSDRLAGGKYAIKGGKNPLEVLKSQETIPFITSEKNYAIPYEPKTYKPEEGDLLFQRILRNPAESRGDIQAYGVYQKKPGSDMGTWTLFLKRKLNTGNYADDIALKDGEIYPIAFAIHDDHVSNRRHYVSFEYTLGLGVPADIKAQKIEW